MTSPICYTPLEKKVADHCLTILSHFLKCHLWFILHIYDSLFSTKFNVFSKGNNLFGDPTRKQDKRRVFDSLSRRLMLNCARRPRINNCILKFVFGHFRAVCSVYRATKFLFGGCFTNPRWKYDFFPDSVEVNIFSQSLFSCNLVLSHLFPIACGTFSKLFILNEWSVFPRKISIIVWALLRQNDVETLDVCRTLGWPQAKTVLPNSFLYSSSVF